MSDPPRFRPVAATVRVSSPFGERVHPVTGVRSGHRGIDFAAAGGTPIYAAQSGTVLYAGAAAGFGGGDPEGRAGWIVIDHSAAQGSGVTVYGHVVAEVGVGARVAAGQRIGTVNGDRATYGDSTGPHLHFEVVGPGIPFSDSARRVDPAPWLADARDPTIPTPSTSTSTSTSNIRKPAAAVATTPAAPTVNAPEKASTAVASADDIVEFLTEDNPAALLYRGREEAASGTGEPGYFTRNIKKVLAEVGFAITTYEAAFDLSDEDPDTPAPVTQRPVLGWVLYIAGSVLDTRRRLKRIETTLDALTNKD